MTALLIDAVPRNSFETIAYISFFLKEQAAGFPGAFHVSRRATGAFLGLFMLSRLDGTDELELGTRLIPEAWGSGVSPEGGAALINYTFSVLAADHLVSVTSMHNRSVPLNMAYAGYNYAGNFSLFNHPARRFVLSKSAWEAQGCALVSRNLAMARLRAWQTDFIATDKNWPVQTNVQALKP